MKKQKQIQPERLTKLAQWLDELKIGLRIDILEDTSNTFGEAHAINIVPVFITPIQNLPKIFKNEWKLTRKGEFAWREDDDETTISSIQKFFGIDCEMLMHLFAPYGQSNQKFGGKLLKSNANPKDIAFNIQELVKLNNNAMNLHPGIGIFISKN